LRDGESVALVLEESAFHEDCARAEIVISPLYAPRSCAPKILLDRGRLAESGAVTFAFGPKGMEWRTARAPGEDRPWSRAPRRRLAAMPSLAGKGPPQAHQNDEAPEDLAE
jgi:competence protein ComEC